DFLGVAMVGSGDRAVVHQSSERRPVCHQRQSGPTPNEAIRCRSKAPKAERSAVGSQLSFRRPLLLVIPWRSCSGSNSSWPTRPNFSSSSLRGTEASCFLEFSHPGSPLEVIALRTHQEGLG